MIIAFRSVLFLAFHGLAATLVLGTAFPVHAADAVSVQAAKASADLAWLMAAAGMVMMMQVGFLLLEAGMVRSKNSINVAQ